MEWFFYFKNLLFVITITLVRITVLFSVLPLMGKSIVPGIARNVVLLSLSAALIPMVYPTVPQFAPDAYLLITAIVLKEAVIGLCMAFLISIVFWVAEGVGFFIDNQRGASSASMFNPTIGDQSSPLGVFMSQVVIVLFFSTGGFMMLLAVIFKSYQLWPIAEFFPKIDYTFELFFLHTMDRFSTLVVVLVAPVALCLFLSEFGLGMMNRFAQQLNVFSLAMPVKSGVAALLIVIYLQFLIKYLGDELATIRLSLDLLNPILT